MKSISRKLSALVKQSKLPYTDSFYEIIDSKNGEDENFHEIAEKIENYLTGNHLVIDYFNNQSIPYALKINFICTDCNAVISSTVNQVSIDNIEEMIRRTLTTKNGTVTAVNIDFFIYAPEISNNFIEDQYCFSILFIMV